MNTALYTNYFRQLAVKHHQLQHNPDSETGDAPLGEKHFARYGTDEIITGLRTKLSFPALLIELYEVTTNASIPAVKAAYRGAFSIYKTAGMENYQEQEAAYDEAETILYDCLAQIFQDHYGPLKERCQTPFEYFGFDNMHIMPVGPVFESQFGWRCEFDFRMNKIPSITTAPAAGVFNNEQAVSSE